MPDAGKGLTLRFMFLMGGLVGVAFGTVWLFIRWDEAKRYARLKAGKGVIARWTIDPAHWEKFRRQSKEWDQLEGVRPNDANLEQIPGAAGIEIVVTGDSMLLGEAFYAFVKNVRIQSLTERMEFHQTIYKRYGPQWHIVLRIPLAAGGQDHCARIIQAYNQASVAAVVTPRTKIYAFILLIGGLAALTGLVALATHLLKISP